MAISTSSTASLLQLKNAQCKIKAIQSGRRFSHFNPVSPFSFAFLVIAVGMFIIPLATSQKLTSGRSTSLDNTKGSEKNYLNAIVPEPNTPIHPRLKQLHDLVKPRRARRKAKRSNRNRRSRSSCPKKWRDFCMNAGKCEWIPALRKPHCRCASNWEGNRCQVPRIKLTSSENPMEKNSNLTIIIAVVLAITATIFVILSICICWRRCKSIRDQLQDDVELEKKQRLIENQSVNSFTSNGNLR